LAITMLSSFFFLRFPLPCRLFEVLSERQLAREMHSTASLASPEYHREIFAALMKVRLSTCF
jgi:hypothetical protein